LRDELKLSYTVGGLHFSALALGLVIGGLVTDRAVRRWQRPVVFWGGGAGMALGALIVGVGRWEAITIAGSWVMGFLGTFLLTTIQSGLADRHGPNRAVALTESNIGASFCAGLAPLFVGGFQRAGIGWRGGVLLPVVLWIVLTLWYRREPIPTAQPSERKAHAAGGALPRIFWVYWAVLLFSVAAEWSIAFWGADFLASEGGLQKADASSVMSFFFVAMVIGRLLGSRLTRVMDTSRLLLGALAIALGGFALFWLAPLGGLRIVGLFVAGLGIANLFPFVLAIGVSISPEQSDAASARIVLGAGVAILVAPQLLGTMADQIGVWSAYGLVAVVLVIAAGIAVFARRLSSGQNEAAQAATEQE
ncbi:MAG: MFS transporter, partial [Anaerolineae bacterium]|nr:MFS transporter [Anaerolineae bacterium]